MEGAAGNFALPRSRLQRVSAVVRFTPLVLASEMAGGLRLHFFIVNKLYWIIITFSGAVTLLAKRDVNPAATRSAAPLLFTHMAYMAAHRPEPSATPDTVVWNRI